MPLMVPLTSGAKIILYMPVCIIKFAQNKNKLTNKQTNNINVDNMDAIKSDCWLMRYTVNQHILNNTCPPKPSEINIFTDGSKTDEHVGSGYVIYKHTEEIEQSQ